MTIVQLLTKWLRRKSKINYIPNGSPIGAVSYNWSDIRWER